MNGELVRKIKCWSLDGREIVETVAVEESVRVHVESSVAELRCSPQHLRELGAGYAVTEGLLKAERVGEVNVEGRDVFVKSGIRHHSGHTESFKSLTDIVETVEMLKNAEIWNLTAGTHSAILKSDRTYFCEDVSRSCAVDKVVGMAVLNGSPLASSFLAVSCRLSEIIVRKAVNAGIPIVASKAAVTSSGMKLAEKEGVTLIGFVRDGRGKVFTHPERLW